MKKNQREILEMKTKTDLKKEKNSLEVLKIRLAQAKKKWFNELKDSIFKITNRFKKKKKRLMKNDKSLRDLWDTIKPENIYIMEVPEEEEKKWTESLFEKITARNFPKSEDMDIQNSKNSKQDRYNPVISLLKICAKEFKAESQRDLCTLCPVEQEKS